MVALPAVLFTGVGGGDEFAILLPNTKVEQGGRPAMAAADRGQHQSFTGHSVRPAFGQPRGGALSGERQARQGGRARLLSSPTDG